MITRQIEMRKIAYVHDTPDHAPIETRWKVPRFLASRGFTDMVIADQFTGAQNLLLENADEGIARVTLSQLDERIHASVDEISEEAGDRSVVYRIHLVGRGRVHHNLATPDSAQELARRLIEEGRDDHEPFLWCAGIKTTTASEINLNQLRKGNDAVGDFLKLKEEFAQDTTLPEQLEPELELEPV